MRRLVWCALALILPSLPTAARAQAPYANATTIGKVDSVWSGALKEQRKFLVYTPPSYNDTTYLPQKYPVLYLLDGDAHFHSVTGLLQILGTGVNGTFVVPEMIVVAIPNTDRTRDLTPTHVEAGPDGKPQPFLKTSGGMPNFFQFLKAELIPKIEGAYRTTPYRVFVGHSLGGITTINALYEIPETFNAYVAIDPSLWYDNQVLLKKAKDYFGKARLSGRSLYVGQANTINPDDTTSNTHFNSIVQFNGVLETYNQSGLRYAYKYYAGDDHGSVPLISEYDALRFIFDGYKIDFGRAMGQPDYLTEHFAKISAALGYTVHPSERMLHLLGGFQLTQDTTKALALFQLYTALYPASPQAHESLGRGWLARGDTTKATTALEKALSLKPGNARVTDLLGEIRKKKP